MCRNICDYVCWSHPDGCYSVSIVAQCIGQIILLVSINTILDTEMT